MEQIKIHNNNVEITFANFYTLQYKVATQNDVMSRLDAAIAQQVIVKIISPNKEDITNKFMLDGNPIISLDRFAQLNYMVSKLK